MKKVGVPVVPGSEGLIKSKEEAIEKGTRKLEQEIETEIQEKKNIIRQKCKCRRNRRICSNNSKL